MSRNLTRTIAAAVVLLAAHTAANRALADDAVPVEFSQGNGRLTVAIDGLPVAVYCYQDEKTPRPFFAHVRAASGIQVTRHHPPIEGQDLIDHEAIHPGVWMAFGDISGSDYWRLKAVVRHAEFAESPQDGNGRGSFAVRNEYLRQNDPSEVVCEETARFTFIPHAEGHLLLWDSTFSSDREFTFGDQEEMGLGIRIASPLRVDDKEGAPPGNGTILDAKGRKNGDEVWGNSADWCDYSGTIAGQRVGIVFLCHPENFRPSWFHARDYGFMAANPFGRAAFSKGEKSSIVVRPGESLRLRYGLLIHSGPAGSQPAVSRAYADYIQLSAE